MNQGKQEFPVPAAEGEASTIESLNEHYDPVESDGFPEGSTVPKTTNYSDMPKPIKYFGYFFLLLMIFMVVLMAISDFIS